MVMHTYILGTKEAKAGEWEVRNPVSKKISKEKRVVPGASGSRP
jgi:hypothetical protein